MWPRYQLAAYSPISLRAGGAAGFTALGLAPDRRPELLEWLLREYSADQGVLCGTGTQALQLAITTALGLVGAGVPVALPAFSCFDVASAAVGAGAPILLYDVDPATLSPDEESLERALESGARVVVVASLYGMPVLWEVLRRCAARHGAILIEDAAQGYGARWHDRPLGSLGDLSVLSFGRGKGWTGGNGGAVLARRSPGGATLRFARIAPTTIRPEQATVVGLLAQWALGRPSIYGIPRSIPGLGLGETIYHAPAPPREMTRAAAAALWETRERSETEAQFRRDSATSFLRGLRRVSTVQPIPVHEGGTAGYLRLPIRLEGGVRALDSRRSNRLGIAPSYPSTLAALPVVAERLSGPVRKWPGAEQLVRELVTLPTHSRVRWSERKAISRLLGAEG